MALVTGYRHTSSQQERLPTQVQTSKPGTEGGVRGAGPNRTHM